MRCCRAASVGAEDRGELAAAERGGERERIVAQRRVAGERRIDDGALAREPGVVDAGAAAGPARAAAAEQRGRERGRRRGVADAHLAEADEIGRRRVDRVMAGATAARNVALVHGGRLREIGGRLHRARAR